MTTHFELYANRYAHQILWHIDHAPSQAETANRGYTHLGDYTTERDSVTVTSAHGQGPIQVDVSHIAFIQQDGASRTVVLRIPNTTDPHEAEKRYGTGCLDQEAKIWQGDLPVSDTMKDLRAALQLERVDGGFPAAKPPAGLQAVLA